MLVQTSEAFCHGKMELALMVLQFGKVFPLKDVIAEGVQSSNRMASPSPDLFSFFGVYLNPNV